MGRLLMRFRWIHPPLEDLVEWADGSGRPGRNTGRHLQGCQECRTRALLIRRACQKAREDGPGAGDASALAAAFERLEAGMRAWPRHARLTRTVEVYFGREAASRLAKVSGGCEPAHHLALSLKPMFSAFLGAAAADALAEQIAGAEC